VVLHQKKYPYIIFNGKDLRLQANNAFPVFFLLLVIPNDTSYYFVLLRITWGLFVTLTAYVNT